LLNARALALATSQSFLVPAMNLVMCPSSACPPRG